MPKLSVILSSYNAENRIEKTIQSIISQTYKDFELILTDRNSKDKTLEIAGKYKDNINKWISEPGRGLYDALNKGVLLAQGEYILFLNPGDIFVSDNSLEKISKYLSDVDIISFNTDLFYPKINKHKIYCLNLEKKYFLSEGKIYLSSEIVSRNLLETSGGFDSRFRILGDKEFLLRTILKENAKIKSINEIFAVIEENNKILSPKSARRYQNEKNALKKLYFSKWENIINGILYKMKNGIVL